MRHILLFVALTVVLTGSAAAQCTKDIECKGDRICVKGECVSPSVPAPPADAIRRVDFLNGFRLPEISTGACEEPLSRVTLRKGDGETKDCEVHVSPPSFGDVTGDGRDDAAVGVHVSVREGNHSESLVLLYELADSTRVRLIGKFAFAGREEENLAGGPDIFGSRLTFVTAVWDSEDAACCPSLTRRYTYLWKDGAAALERTETSRDPDSE